MKTAKEILALFENYALTHEEILQAMELYAQEKVAESESKKLKQAHVSGNEVTFSQKDMENFAAKMLLTFDKSSTLKEELKLFCENDR